MVYKGEDACSPSYLNCNFPLETYVHPLLVGLSIILNYMDWT